MNKKGIIAVIVIIAIAATGFALSRNSAKAPVTPDTAATPVTKVEVPAGVTKDTYAPVTKDSTDTTLIGKLKKASVGVSEDGSRVALVNGVASFTVSGASVKSTVTLGDVAIEKTSGSRKDALATVAVNNGGAVTNTYVVLFEDKNGGTLADKSYSLVGENVKVTGIRADAVSDASIDYIVSVSFTDKAGKAHTKILVVEAGLFNSAKEINL
jgi:hypothetical protein